MSGPEVYVYVLALRRGDELVAPVKIGISQNPEGRRREVSTSCPHPVVLFRKFRMPNRKIALDVERCFHQTHPEDRTNGEWFEIEPTKAAAILSLQIVWALECFAGLSGEEMAVACRLAGIEGVG